MPRTPSTRGRSRCSPASREADAPRKRRSSEPVATPRLREVHVAGYRSLRDLRVPLERESVVVGANGVGKTNLYSALRLAQAAALGTLGRTIADEGRLPSLLWAGPRNGKDPVRVVLAVSFDDLEYRLEIGMPPLPSGFPYDSEVKEERLRVLVGASAVLLLERSANSAFARDDEGQRVQWPLQLWSGESVLSQIRDPGRFPILAELSVRLARLRFYHQFDVGRSSPIRAPQVGVRTGLLSDDGRDLAAAIATIEDIGDARGFHGAVSRAFPGSSVAIDAADGVSSLTMRMSGLTRALGAHRRSDGALRFLCLAAALTAPRPPSFGALNEPESTSTRGRTTAAARPCDRRRDRDR